MRRRRMNSRPHKITFVSFLALIAISLLISSEGCTKKDIVSISIIDKYNTPNFDIIVSPYSVLKNQIFSGSADRYGNAKFDLEISKVVDLTVFARGKNSKWKSVAHISVKELKNAIKYKKTISRTISLIPAQRKITFTSPYIEGIKIYGINGSNQRELLGTTNYLGDADIYIPYQKYKKIKFSYSLSGASVFTDGLNDFTYENMPSQKSLKAIPAQDIYYTFDCIDSDSKEGIGGVRVTSSDSMFLGITSDSGLLRVRIIPNQNSGPYIGDKLQWMFNSTNHVALDQVTSTISSTPPDTVTVSMKRSYSLIVRAVEGGIPLPGQYIKIDDNRYERTDNNGAITYRYFAEDLATRVNIGIEATEGRSSKAQTVQLGRVKQTIVLQIDTIHQYMECLDTVTGERINSAIFSGSDVQANATRSGTRTKLLFPRLGNYEITISNTTGLHEEKRLSLSLNEANNGDTKTIYLDPLAIIDFSIIGTRTQQAITQPRLEINGQSVSGSLDGGRYRYTFTQDDLLKIDVKVSADGYATKQMSFDRHFGIMTQNIELENLYANVMLVSQTGEPAIDVKVKLGNTVLGQVDENGMLKLSPDHEGQIYNLTITSEKGLYEESVLPFVFDINGKQIEHILTKQPWLEFRVFQPTDFGNIRVDGVTVTSSTGQAGITDASGIFRYRIVDKNHQITFKFIKPTYESIELKQYTTEQGEVTEVAMPRLEAFFYIRDVRTQIPVPNVSIRVNGNLETLTDNNGRANIFPIERPLDLNIEARPQGRDYFAKTVTKQYSNPNLGIIFLDPRPIKLHVTLKWAGSGLPVNGGLELVPSHLKYSLTSKDHGRHTFDYYDKNRDPKLIITATTPTGNPFTKEVPISLAMVINGEINIPLNIRPRPRITVNVDDDVLLSIYRHTIHNSLVPIETEVLGGYTGELPDFGQYTFVRYSGSFVEPDSIFKYVTKSNEILDLTRQPYCSAAEALFANHSWEMFLEKVNEITIETDCYGKFNKKAAEVCKNELKEYEDALKYYQNITSGDNTSVIDGFDPKIDPYIRLNMLECCFLAVKDHQEDNSKNLQFYKIGKQQVLEFDKLLHLLHSNSNQAQRKKELLFCRLLLVEFWSTDPSKVNGGSRTSKAKADRENLYHETIAKLEKYQSKPKLSGFPSLQTELDQIMSTTPWP